MFQPGDKVTFKERPVVWTVVSCGPNSAVIQDGNFEMTVPIEKLRLDIDSLREYAIECAVVMQMENSSSGGNSPEQNQATRKAANFVDALVELIEARTANSTGLNPKPIMDFLRELRESSGHHWDEIEDPKTYLSE